MADLISNKNITADKDFGFNKEDKSVTRKFLRFFNIGVQGKQNVVSAKVFPTDLVKDKQTGESHRVREVFPPEVRKYYDKWLFSSHDDAQSWKNRNDLWYDCDLLYYNSPLIAKAMELIADEVIQADTHEQPITIEAKPKQKQFIQKLFDTLNIYSFLRPTALNIIKYGNAGWILALAENGIDGIIPISIFDLKDRLEFSAYRVKQLVERNDKFFTAYKSKILRIDQLVDMIQNNDNIVSYFKEYLFGFVVGDYAIPPWRFLHFRNFTTESPFKPFGVPVFIHSIAPYRQFDSAMTMQIAARGARLPIDMYKLKFPNTLHPTEKLNRALEFMNEWQNSGINAVNKEENGVGSTVITIEDLFEFEQKVSNIDLGKIDDIDLLRDDLILSTLLPRFLLDPKDSGFGTSGVSAIQEWKPLARLVYRIQQLVLQQVSQLVKIHMIHSNEFALDDLDFILSMPYPETMTNSDMINNQKDLLGLANDVIQSLADKLTGGEIAAIPPEVIKTIYTKFLPYDDKTIYKWMKDILDQKQKNTDTPPEAGQEEDEDAKVDAETKKAKKLILRELWESVEAEHETKTKLNETIQNHIYDHKQLKLREGVLLGKHYYSSCNQDPYFDPKILREIDIKLACDDSKKPGVTAKRKTLKEAEEKFEVKKYKFSYGSESKDQMKRPRRTKIKNEE
jgi:hypothetical protein